MIGILKRLGRAMGAQPVRVAGGICALLATSVLLLQVQTQSGTAAVTGLADVPLSSLVSFAMAHPAYPVAIVVGLLVLFAR